MQENREEWGSKVGFILASAGSAIGIGAIWKLPYVAATAGGGAFFLIVFSFNFARCYAAFNCRICDWTRFWR